MRGWLFGVAVLMLAVGCSTRKNPAKCDSNAECEAPLSFCDVNGEFEESGFEPNTCTVRPDGCPLERCGCDPGVPLTCDVDQLTVCNADGVSTSTLTCGLGCSTATPRCLTFEPSNGLGPALAMAAAEPDVVLPADARIDTELGTVVTSTGVPIPVRSMLVTQEGGNSIRAFFARSFVVGAATIEGTHSIALIASGPISLRGLFDASAAGPRHGPGGQDLPAVCAGVDSQEVFTGTTTYSVGAGGGGNATMGGAGGGFNAAGSAGGVTIPGFVPLVGGCRGGNLRTTADAITAFGGGGGGAVQLVSNEGIRLSNAGLIHVGGGGGEFSAGGGSGGTVVLEAPLVSIDGATSGIASNGGAGGGCGLPGEDAHANNNPAAARSCTAASSGVGGTASILPGAGQNCTGSCVLNGRQGSGGAAVGRTRIATRDGTYATSGTPIQSTMVTGAVLTPR